MDRLSTHRFASIPGYVTAKSRCEGMSNHLIKATSAAKKRHRDLGTDTEFLKYKEFGVCPQISLSPNFSRIRRNAHDSLDLKKFLEPELTPFPTISGLLVSTERGCIIETRAVYVYVPGAKARSELQSALCVAGRDVAGQPVYSVVGDPHSVVFVLVRQDR